MPSLAYKVVLALLNVFVLAVLLAYCIVYALMSHTLRQIQGNVQEFTLPSGEPSFYSTLSSGGVDNEPADLDPEENDANSSFLVSKRGKALMTRSQKVKGQKIEISNRYSQGLQAMTVEIPWESIKVRYHVFFVGSIVFTSLSFTLNLLIAEKDNGLYGLKATLFYSIFTLVGTVCFVLYETQVDDSFVHQH